MDSASNPYSNTNVKREVDAILTKANTTDVTNNDFLLCRYIWPQKSCTRMPEARGGRDYDHQGI